MEWKKNLTGMISALALMTGCSTLDNKCNIPENKDYPKFLSMIKTDFDKRKGKEGEEIILCLGNFQYHVPGKSRVALYKFIKNYKGEQEMQRFAYVTNDFPISQTKTELVYDNTLNSYGYTDLILTVKNEFTGKEKDYLYRGNDCGEFLCVNGGNWQE